MKTQAVVFTAPRTVRFQDIDVPELRDDEALVRTEWSWISNGTEGSFLRGERADGETPSSPERPAPYPIVAGYQRVGVVVAAGPSSGFAEGDRVFATITRLAGLAADHGGHVAVGPVHRSQLRKLPPDGPPQEAYSGLVLTQVGYNCGIRPDLSGGDAVVVIGDGMVGQWAAQTARERGARVMILGRHASRLGRYPARPEDRLVNTREEDDLAAVKAWAPEGVQAIIDTVGTVPTLERLFFTLRHRGHLVSAGYCGEQGRIDIQLLRKREASLHAPSGWSAERLDATLEWVRQGRLDTLGLVTDRLPAPRAAEAWERIEGRKDETLGVLLDWREVDR